MQRFRYLILIAIIGLTINVASGSPSALDKPASWRSADTALSAADTRVLPPLDGVELGVEDSIAEAMGQPPRFAVPHEMQGASVSSGTWTVEGDIAYWRLRVQAANAVSLNFGFKNVHLVENARLWIYAANAAADGVLDRDEALGPYGTEINKPHQQFWTPVVLSNDVIIELEVPAKLRSESTLELAQINQGYRGFGKVLDSYEQPAAPIGEGKSGQACSKAGAKSGSCNMDVACLDSADPWNEPRRSVARYTINGSGLCTGSLVNNTSNDRRMLFATASHCTVTAENAATIVAYWDYESPTCRTPGGSASGQVTPPDSTLTSSGGTFLARTPNPFDAECTTPSDCSDFVLVELERPTNPAIDLYWAGWDRRTAPASCGPQTANDSTAGLCASVHQPSGHEKRITFVERNLEQSDIANAQGVHWKAFWDPTPPILSGVPLPQPSSIPPGVTEPGSSGSPLYSADRRFLGVLSGGASFCGATGSSLTDEYGQLAHAWNGLGTPTTRVRDYLDPQGTGAQFIDGIKSDSSPPGGECTAEQSSVVVWSDDMESGLNGWTLGAGSVQNTWAQTTTDAVSGNTSWNATNLATVSDQRLVSPPIALPSSGPLALRFQNRQELEDGQGGCFDAGILEISTNDGASWSELNGNRIKNRPHDGPVSNEFNNPLAGSQAWCGDPRGWEDYIIDLSDFAGNTVRLRYRVGTDASIGGRAGWLIDDVRVTSCGGVQAAEPISGSWYNPARSGEGCQLTRESDGATFVLSCYTYRGGDQVWMIGAAGLADSKISVNEMVIPEGASYGSAFDPADVTRVPFGPVEMAFQTCNSATVKMNPIAAGFEDVLLPMERIVPVDCSAGTPDPTNSARAGNWFNQDRSGEGFQLAVEGSSGLHVITYYTFFDGQPVWLIGTGVIEGDTIVFSDMQVTTGTGFGSQFDPDDVVRIPFGTLTMTFSDCNNAVIDVDSVLPQFEDQQIDVTRIVPGACP